MDVRSELFRRTPVDDVTDEGGSGLQRSPGLFQLTVVVGIKVAVVLYAFYSRHHSDLRSPHGRSPHDPSSDR